MGKKYSKVLRYKKSLLNKQEVKPKVIAKKFLCVYNDEMDWTMCEYNEWMVIKAKKNPDPEFFIELNFDFEEEQIFY